MIRHLGLAHLSRPLASDAEAPSFGRAAWARGSDFPCPARDNCAIGFRDVKSSFFVDEEEGSGPHLLWRESLGAYLFGFRYRANGVFERLGFSE